MGIVMEKLLDEQKRSIVISDCTILLDSEVDSKKGLTGLVIKGGYKAFKAVKPTIVTDALDHLFDDFVKVLDNHYEQYQKSEISLKKPFTSWAGEREMVIADDMLKITDDIMNRSDKTALKKIYSGLRNVAQKNVAQAVPGIAKLVTKHVGG